VTKLAQRDESLAAFTYELVAPRTLTQRKEQLNLTALAPSAVVATTLYSVISPGTEIAAWVGKPALRPGKIYPRVLGYCNVARVHAFGSQVADLTIGDIILTHQCHRSAFYCEQNDILLTLPSSTTIAAQQRLAASYLYHLGYMALLDGGFRPGYEVAVVGFGALGFTAASLVAAYGGRPLVFSSRAIDESSRAAIPHARFFNKNESHNVTICPALGGVDLVVNTSDAWPDYSLSLQLARRGGIITLLGFPGRGLQPPDFNPLDSQFLYDKALTLRQIAHVTDLPVPAIDARFTLKRNLAHLYSLLDDGRLDPAPLINTRFQQANITAALDLLENRTSAAKSVLLEWAC